ncbi:unnamed protein product [Cylicocyclus nassatus]|uniref:Uncharacterized protein n=1 Tax=Cylicocyclus nassatus TaxID=53992 RepID=A0AA36H331_CYLNA|nr:unnamed protein product [Cylicocyclus nassatus]
MIALSMSSNSATEIKEVLHACYPQYDNHTGALYGIKGNEMGFDVHDPACDVACDTDIYCDCDYKLQDCKTLGRSGEYVTSNKDCTQAAKVNLL